MNQQTAKEIAAKIETDFQQLECCVAESSINQGSFTVGVFPHKDRGGSIQDTGYTVIRSETEYDIMMEAVKLFTSPIVENKYGEVK